MMSQMCLQFVHVAQQTQGSNLLAAQLTQDSDLKPTSYMSNRYEIKRSKIAENAGKTKKYLEIINLKHKMISMHLLHKHCDAFL